jgi:uracil-DNA glycosylase family 4
MPLETLFQLQETNRTCKRCPAWKISDCIIPGEGTERAKYFFIFESSQYYAKLAHTVRAGRENDLILKILSDAQIPLEDTYFTNLIKCSCKPKPAYINACKVWLWNEIKLCNPKFILLFGMTVSKTLLPLPSAAKIREIIGVEHTVSWSEAKIIPFYSLATLLRVSDCHMKLTIKILKGLNV